MKKTTAEMEPFLTLQDHFRRIQLRNRFVSFGAFGARLSLLETHLLLEIDADEKSTIGSLTALFELEQSSISRAVQRLQGKKLLAITSSSEDRRRKELSVTEKGRNVLHSFDAYANARIVEIFDTFSGAEKALLERSLESLADRLGAPRTMRRRGDHPFRVTQRRLTRAFGLLGESAFGSGLVSSHYQALAEIERCGKRGAVGSEVREALSIPANNFSGILAALERRNLVRQSKQVAGGRGRLTVTAAGARLLADTQRATANRIMEAFKHEEMHRLRELVSLVGRYAGVVAADQIHLGGETFLHEVKGSEAADARALLVELSVAAGTHYQLPATICGPENVCFYLVEAGTKVGVIQFKTSEEEIVAEVIASDPNGCPSKLVLRAVAAAKTFVRKRLATER